jgi:imidazolonepropionase-like amidohydrolase
MTKRTRLILRNLFACVVGSCVIAAALPAAAQTVITGATVHPVAAEPIEDGVVVVAADGTIAAVGAAGEVEIPEGADIVDAAGKVVTPGFIESSSELGLVEIGAVKGSNDTAPEDLDSDYILAAVRASDAFNPNSAVIPVQRTGGVTSVVSAPSRGVISGQSVWADLGGEGTFATVVEPYAALHGSATRWTVRSAGGSRTTLWLTFRELVDDAKFFAANRASYDQNASRKLEASRLDLEAFGAVLNGTRPLVLAIDRASDIRTAVELARDNELRLVVVGGAEAWMVKDVLAAEKVPVVVEPLSNLPGSFERLGARSDNAALLHEAGVPVIVSTTDTHNVRNLRQMAGNAVRAGLPWEAALRAVTLAPATAYGMADRYGSLEPGKIANLVVWSGDPFEHSTRVEKLYVKGRETSLDNRQKQLFERYRELTRRAEPKPYPAGEPAQIDDETSDEELETTESEPEL